MSAVLLSRADLLAMAADPAQRWAYPVTRPTTTDAAPTVVPVPTVRPQPTCTDRDLWRQAMATSRWRYALEPSECTDRELWLHVLYVAAVIAAVLVFARLGAS